MRGAVISVKTNEAHRVRTAKLCTVRRRSDFTGCSGSARDRHGTAAGHKGRRLKLYYAVSLR